MVKVGKQLRHESNLHVENQVGYIMIEGYV